MACLTVRLGRFLLDNAYKTESQDTRWIILAQNKQVKEHQMKMSINIGRSNKKGKY